jgi:hypothetical protein
LIRGRVLWKWTTSGRSRRIKSPSSRYAEAFHTVSLARVRRPVCSTQSLCTSQRNTWLPRLSKRAVSSAKTWSSPPGRWYLLWTAKIFIGHKLPYSPVESRFQASEHTTPS